MYVKDLKKKIHCDTLCELQVGEMKEKPIPHSRLVITVESCFLEL